MPRAAIEDYHALLTDEIAEEADSALRLKLKERGLYFGDRPICIVLRPHFYNEGDWLFLKNGLETLLTAFDRAYQVCMESPEHRIQLHLDHYEEALFDLDRGSVVPWTSSRLDNFYVIEKRILKCVEYNAETPAGIGYGDVLEEVFEQLEPMKRFRKKYTVRPMPALGHLTDSLLRAYKEWGGQDLPQIAIIDWYNVPTLNEHEITRQYFERRGIKAVLADPRSLEYRNGRLWAGDFRIDMIYKRVLYSELIDQMGMDNVIVRAMRERAVFITNSISAKLMSKKASLAFLSDENNRHLFTAEQQQAIDAHIPWTRLVEERTTLYDGRIIDLVPFIAEHRERFVLKPNDDYGGKGVVIGWECSADGWAATLKQALVMPHVAQERVPVIERDFPTWINGKLDISPRFVDADPYIFYGTTISGCLTRLSPLALLNVTAGGGSVVPTFIITDKN